MTVSEIDTFYFKFKNCLVAGINATLTLNSYEGRAQVTLSANLGHLCPAGPQQEHNKGRNGPARMRQREQRAGAGKNAEAVEASTEKVDAATQTIDKVEDHEEQAVDKDISEESTSKVTEGVSDEFCSNKEYEFGEPFIVNESDDTIIYDIECGDPGNKWIKEDVFNHMGESLEQMFQVYKIKPQDQQYQLDVFEKVNDTFNLKRRSLQTIKQ